MDRARDERGCGAGERIAQCRKAHCALSLSLGAFALTACTAESLPGDRSGTRDAPVTMAPAAGAPSDPPPRGAADGFDNVAGNAAPMVPREVLDPGAGDCRPGHYVGRMGGMYRTAAWGNGTVPVAFGTGDVAGSPGLEFWLERVDVECTDSEFCADFTIKGGKLRGWANPTADPSGAEPAAVDGWGARFEMELTGELDCSRRLLRGLLQNACYDVAGTLYRMEGTLEATYDPAGSRFDAGQWKLVEMPLPNALIPPDPNVGGEGNWEASHQDDASPTDSGMGLCDGMSGFETGF